jgi:hypothetical protein
MQRLASGERPLDIISRMDSRHQAAAMLQLTNEMQSEDERVNRRNQTIDPIYQRFLQMGGQSAEEFSRHVIDHIGNEDTFRAITDDVFLERRRNLEAALEEIYNNF